MKKKKVRTIKFSAKAAKELYESSIRPLKTEDKKCCEKCSCKCKGAVTAHYGCDNRICPCHLEDKNGHKINSNGKLVFDERRYGCDAPPKKVCSECNNAQCKFSEPKKVRCEACGSVLYSEPKIKKCACKLGQEIFPEGVNLRCPIHSEPKIGWIERFDKEFDVDKNDDVDMEDYTAKDIKQFIRHLLAKQEEELKKKYGIQE
jgi:hypothetical protein